MNVIKVKLFLSEVNHKNKEFIMDNDLFEEFNNKFNLNVDLMKLKVIRLTKCQ